MAIRHNLGQDPVRTKFSIIGRLTLLASNIHGPEMPLFGTHVPYRPDVTRNGDSAREASSLVFYIRYDWQPTVSDHEANNITLFKLDVATE